jgi:hypothetical protein
MIPQRGVWNRLGDRVKGRRVVVIGFPQADGVRSNLLLHRPELFQQGSNWRNEFHWELGNWSVSV